jgi:uncharacterized protein (TIRG00374 family)
LARPTSDAYHSAFQPAEDGGTTVDGGFGVMKRWLGRLLRLASLLLFGLILWWAGPDAWRQVVTGNVEHVLIAFFLLSTATALSATRLRLVTHSLAGQQLGSWQRYYYLNITARAIGLVIPRSLSTFAGKPVALRSLGLSIKHSVWTVLVDSGFDLLLLGALLIPALLFLGGRTSAQVTLVLVLGLVLTLMGGFWWITAGDSLLRVVRWAERIPCLEAILPFTSEEATGLLLQRLVAVRALGLTLLLNAALAACYHHISRAVGLSHPWIVIAAGFPAVQLCLVLAVTPGGLGLLDAGWYGVLLMGGVPRNDALTFVVAQRAYVFIFVLACAGFSALLSLAVEELGSG